MGRTYNVRDPLQTHDKVSEHFRHGPHAGECVPDLSDKLLQGRARLDKITPLVVKKFMESSGLCLGTGA